MTGHADRQEMRPEFRAHLEWQIETALRRESRFVEPVTRRVSKLGAALVLLAAMASGAGAVAASQELQDSKERAALLDAVKADLDVARLRLELARTAYQNEQRRVEVGVVSRESLRAAEAELKAMEALVKKLTIDADEVRLTAKAPRNDLQAPVVEKRDFVSDRLSIDLLSAQAALVAAEQGMQDTKRRFDVGIASRVAMLQAEMEIAQTRARLKELQDTLDLRRRAAAGEVKPEDVASQQRRLELNAQLARVESDLTVARARIEEVRRQSQVGQATELDVKRAEIELLERQAELQRLRQEIERLGSVRR